MDSFQEKSSSHQTAIDTLAKVKEAEKQIQRTTVPIKNEHGRVVGHRLVRVGRTTAPQSIATEIPSIAAGYKQCRDCGAVKLKYEFNLESRNKDGRNAKCKLCVAAYVHSRNQKRLSGWSKETKSLQSPKGPQSSSPISKPMKKQCTKCKAVKPLADFSPNRNHKDGRYSACKACVAMDMRARYATKRGAVSAKKAAIEPLTCAQWVAPLTTSAPIAPYNRKGFLLPDSIRSCASYHAKILESGEYMFRIHDCVTGIRLRGYLNDPQEVTEAIGKLEALAAACSAFANHIKGLLQ